MIKRIIVFIMILLMAFPVNNVHALEKKVVNDEDVLESSNDYEIAKGLEDSIRVKVLAIAKESDDKKESILIDYKNAIKVYNDCDIFASGKQDSASIMEIAETGHYAWELPVFLNGRRYRVVLAKGLPLSENAKEQLSAEEQKKIIENEGKLKISSVGTLDEKTRFLYEWINERDYSGYNDPKVRIFGSQPGFMYPIAVLFEGTTASGCFSVGYDSEYMFDQEVVSFEEVLKWVSTISVPASDELNGGTGTKWGEDIETSNLQIQKEFGNKKWLILFGSGLALLIVAGAMIMIFCKKK